MIPRGRDDSRETSQWKGGRSNSLGDGGGGKDSNDGSNSGDGSHFT